ncbi:neuroblast differentiation-associated protein AHNAK-like, partial [Meleagris gallopavo]|uniref:neuroblast differentiation-associated protein AHNAK-like n=1 Tax=Meleagris gallopavo TaxID=9103 RepID=UPI0012AB8A98
MMWVPAGWGSAPRQPLASDSEDEEPPQCCPNTTDTASPRVVPESDLEEPDVSPNVPVLRKRLPTSSTLSCANLDVGGPKKRRLDPKTPPNPGVEPRNRCLSPEEAVGTDVERWRSSDPTLGIESDTDDEEHPKSAVLHPNRHQSALERSADPGVAQRTQNPDVGGSRNGRWVLTVDSDTDKEEAELLPPVRRPKIRRKAPNAPRSAVTVGVKSPQSDPRGPNNGFQVSVVGSDTDVEVGSSDLGVGSSQSGQWVLTVDSDTDADESGADPDMERPQNHQNVPKVGLETPGPPPGGPREDRLVLMVDSDTGVEDRGLDPDVLCSTTHRVTQNAPNSPSFVADGPQNGQRAPTVGGDPDVGGPPSGDPDPEVGGPKIRQQLPLVDSDTDVEEDTAYPRDPVGTPKPLLGAGVVMETPNPHLKGSQRGGRNLEVDSDTDVEGEELHPDVPHPKKPQMPQIAPKDPAVVMGTLNSALKGFQVGCQSVEVGRDTDVEEELNPDVPHLKKKHGMPQIAPKNPGVVMETPNPDLKGPRVGDQSLEVDSDTDVEEELSPDVPHLKNPKTPQSVLKNPAVVMETPNPDPKGPRVGAQSLEVDSDTDVEEELNPDVSHPKNPKTPQITPKDPAVVMETPNPDPKGPQVGDRSVDVSIDTDVEGEESNPDVPHPENPKTPQITPKDPAVVMETPNPDVVALNGDSDTDVEDLGGVEAPQTHKATQRFIDSDAVAASAPDVAPDVAVTAPNPAVSPPLRPEGGSDTDGEEVAPTPHIRSLRSRIRPRNPNVGSAAMSGGADVGQMNPKRGKSTQKRQSLPPEPCGDGGVGGTAPKRHSSAPDTEMESPKPSGGTQRHGGETSRVGSGTAAAPAPKSPDPAPNLGLAVDGQHRPNGDTDVTESDTEAEDDPDLFLASTQNFLPSTQNFLPPTQNFLPPSTQGCCPPDPTPAWDPEEPTQCFY